MTTDASRTADPAARRAEAGTPERAGAGGDPLQGERLRSVVAHHFPERGRRGRTAANILALHNPAFPVVAISRDAEAEDRVVPVYFVSAAKDLVTRAFLYSMHDASGGVVKLGHFIRGGRRRPGYAVIPALYHLQDVDVFEDALLRLLGDWETRHTLAWIRLPCRVDIRHQGKTYRAIRNPGGGLWALSRDA